jgi:integrative and conjugative element protein (TIGR02256 family)
MYFDLWLLDRMKAFRYSKLPNETGGILIGAYDFQRKIIYIGDSLFAPPDSIEDKYMFERGVEGLLDEYNKYIKVVDNQLCYLGEWHSHPEGCSTNPSTYDFKLYEYLYNKMSRQGSPVLMGILGDYDCKIIFKS